VREEWIDTFKKPRLDEEKLGNAIILKEMEDMETTGESRCVKAILLGLCHITRKTIVFLVITN
jgi:hypothetical protein